MSLPGRNEESRQLLVKMGQWQDFLDEKELELTTLVGKMASKMKAGENAEESTGDTQTSAAAAGNTAVAAPAADANGQGKKVVAVAQSMSRDNTKPTEGNAPAAGDKAVEPIVAANKEAAQEATAAQTVKEATKVPLSNLDEADVNASDDEGVSQEESGASMHIDEEDAREMAGNFGEEEVNPSDDKDVSQEEMLSEYIGEEAVKELAEEHDGIDEEEDSEEDHEEEYGEYINADDDIVLPDEFDL